MTGKISHFNYFEHSKYKKYISSKFSYADPKNPTLFIDSLKQVLSECPRLIIFPTGEELISCILRNQDALKDYDCVVPVPDYKTYKEVSDKYSFSKLILKCGINTPKEITSIPTESDIPFVAKPMSRDKIDIGIEAPILVLSKKDYTKFMDRHVDMKSIFVQEYIEGQSVYYCALYKNGDLVANFSQINLHQQPCGKSVIKACPVVIPTTVTSKIDKMMEDLRWTGVMMIELKLSNNGFKAIELNPRFWGPLQLSLDNGVDFPYLLYCVASNLSIPKPISKQSAGYYWLTGYLYGIGLKIFYGGKFQRYKSNHKSYRVKYRDVWLRSDSLVPFFEDIHRPLKYALSKIFKFNKGSYL